MPLNLYSKESTDTLLGAKLDLAGGTMTGGLTLSASGIIFSDATYLTTAPAGFTLAADQLTAGVVAANPTSGPTTAGDVLQYNGSALVWAAGGGGSFNGGAITNPITIAGATIDSEMSSDFFGVELTADTTKGSVLYYTGLDTYDGSSHMLVGPTGLTFPDSTTQTTAGIGDAPSDGSQYARKDGAWEVVTGGGGVAWGAITGTLSSQTDLQTALDAKQAKPTLTTVSTSSDYYATASNANGVVYLDPSSNGIANVYLPDGDTGYEFPNGSSITIINRSGGFSPVSFSCYGSAFSHVIYGSATFIDGTALTFYKISGNDWFVR